LVRSKFDIQAQAQSMLRHMLRLTAPENDPTSYSCLPLMMSSPLNLLVSISLWSEFA